MKKCVLALFALLSVFACKKVDQPQQLVEATFGYSFDSGRFPTKSFVSEITDRLPESIQLTLTNQSTDVQYSVNSGESITLPIGTYEVTGAITPEATQFVSGTARYLSKTPKITISEVVEVTAGKSDYSVTATYGSFALGILPSEVSQWKGRFKGNMADVDYIESDGLSWVFVTGNLDPTSLFYTTITPIAGSQRSFSIITSGTYDGGMMCEYGKWYILHPSGASTQSGTIGVDLPTWQQG